MLKISEMAKLANTTRRTLIYYDEQGLFKPAKITATGYRYYDYQQLYDLTFILGLKNLGLSLEAIKKIQAGTSASTQAVLTQAQAQINQRIVDLQQIQRVLLQKIVSKPSVKPQELYQPCVSNDFQTIFWCSRSSVTCTEEEIAELFSEFYQQLDDLAMMDTTPSGFLTQLPVTQPNGYIDASFRIIKAISEPRQTVVMPELVKAAGRYASILVENTVDGIVHGLTELKAFCEDYKLRTQDQLWQLNIGDTLVTNGASKYGWLKYAILDQ